MLSFSLAVLCVLFCCQNFNTHAQNLLLSYNFTYMIKGPQQNLPSSGIVGPHFPLCLFVTLD